MSISPNAEEQEIELNPNDIWLMRAAGGEDDLEDDDGDDVQREEDQFSFEDSERFEEDSLCSWVSDTESLNQNWRGWNARRSSNSHLAAADSTFPESLPVASTSHRYLSGYSSGSHRSRHSSNGTLKVNSPIIGSSYQSSVKSSRNAGVTNGPRKLAELSARTAARCFSFNLLEASYRSITNSWAQQRIQRKSCDSNDNLLHLTDSFAEQSAIPDKFFLSIVWWCFPESEEDIRLYSCLANGNVEEFGRGEYLYQTDAVRDIFQIGFHLSATIVGSVTGSMSGEVLNPSVSPTQQTIVPGRQLSKATHNVSVRVDRCRIVSCTCSCNYKASWCQHVVAACLHRINRSQEVQYRVTIWDSINELNLRELKKFAQFFINELPRQYIPVAQRLIDQLRNPGSDIHAAVGAPDPTDGGHDEVAIWCLDQKMLHENIRRILAKFCLPSPTVHCDVHYLSSSQPAAAAEWQLLLRPHRSKEPEGLWNLMSIVREMLKRRDENATTLLHIVTEECLGNPQVLMWWYQTCLTHSGRWFLCSSSNKPNPLMSNQNVPQFSCAFLCEEIMQLWRLTALNPRLQFFEREQLASFLQLYHRNVCEKIWKIICSSDSKSTGQSQSMSSLFASVVNRQGERLCPENARFTVDLFPGFFNAFKACRIDWDSFDLGTSEINGGRNAGFEQLFSNLSSAQSMSGVDECGSSYSLNNLSLNRCMRFSDDGALSDICSSTCHISHHHHHRNIYQQNAARPSTKRKKNKLLRKKGLQSRLCNDGSETKSVPIEVRLLHEGGVSEEVEEESAESGQESEDPGPSSKMLKSNNRSVHSLENITTTETPGMPSGDIDELFAFAHEPMSSFDVKFTMYEALVSHGYQRLACKFATELANDIMKRPVKHGTQGSKLYVENVEQNESLEETDCESPALTTESRQTESSQNALIMLARVNSLVQTLMKDRSTYKLAFALAIFVLEMPRSPASTKFLEEMELVSLIRRIEITQAELNIVRECARRFIANAPARAAKVCALPISLAHYILDALSYAHNVTSVSQGRRYGFVVTTRGNVQRYPNDEELSVKVALEVLNMKLLVSEADFPMLCENTRRQRGELALTMLMRYKDSTEKLAVVLDGLLDPKMHRMYKDHLSNAAYFVEQDVNYSRQCSGQRPKYPSHMHDGQWLKENAPQQKDFPDGFSSVHLTGENAGPFSVNTRQPIKKNVDREIPRLVEALRISGRDYELLHSRRSEIFEDGTDGTSEDSSCARECGVMLESCSASGDGSGSASPSHRIQKRNDSLTDTPYLGVIRLSDLSNSYFRYPRRKPVPNLPNQPSEAHAHYMMELAKRLLVEAGGSQSTAVFNAAQNIGMQNNPQHAGPHRQLHICSFLIGLYALGLSNLVSTSWQTRTYSTNVSWINGQAIEIGSPAIRIVERVWESHLTPTETADLADKASQSRDPGMVEAAAKLALSVLPKAYALTATESQKALHQCKEQSEEMLERACHAVEQAAEKDGVYPEVLFKVAHLWYDMFCECESSNSKQCSSNLAATSAPVSQSSLGPSPSSTSSVYVSPAQAFSSYVANTPPPPLQMPLYHSRQQSLCPQPQYFHFPPHHSHNVPRPPVVLTTGSPIQPPQVMVPYGLRQNSVIQSPSNRTLTQQHVSRHCAQTSMSRTSVQQPVSINPPQQSLIYNSMQHQILPGYPQQQSIAHSSRVLHVSHSAPNLNPIQVPACRRGVPANMTPSGQHYGHVATIPEHAAQGSVIARQHQVPPNVIMSANTMPNQTGGPGIVVPTYYGRGSQVNLTSIFSGDPRMAKLVHAHRVGMKAMETMGNRNHDDTRGYAKFSQNPAYADDVLWLFTIASKLGGVFVQSFCEVAARAVTSPFILYNLALKSREIFKNLPSQMNYHPTPFFPCIRSQYTTPIKYNAAPKDVRIIMIQNGNDPTTADLMQHCIEMFYAAASSKLSHPRFVPSDTEEVVQLVKTAREAFYTIPIHGKLLFEDFLRHVKKQKACKRDVIERIKNCLQQQSS